MLVQGYWVAGGFCGGRKCLVASDTGAAGVHRLEGLVHAH